MDDSNKGIISTAYQRLAGVAGALGGAFDAPAVGQEMLDFLAMLDGLKPVLLVGRGLDDERWVAGVLGVARSLNLAIVETGYWSARPPPAGVPHWYAEHVAARLAAGRAWAVTPSDGTAAELRALAAGDGPNMAAEARLLGYPHCCVAAHYDRADAWHRLTFAVLGRRAGGDAPRMRAQLETGAAIAPETAAEKALYAEATGFKTLPFTSWNMCAACAADPDGPSARLAARYRALAKAVDPQLAALLAGS